MVTVLVPQEIAERCYLSEALLWVALNRLPLSFITEHNVDAREDDEYVENEEPFLPDGGVVTNEECEAAGLKPNPEWEDIESGKSHSEPEHLEGLLKSELGDELRKELNQELSDSTAFRKRQAEWDQEFNEFADKYRQKLYLSLHEGRLPALGKKRPRPSISAHRWKNTPWERIPSEFWISYKIDWPKSQAEGRGAAYSFILIETNDLIREFPLPAPQAAADVVKIGNYFALPSNGKGIVRATRKLGRPPLNWDEFHLEVAKRVHKGTLPHKQESFISEMQEWCKRHWGCDVGRSTLLQKIKPYYDTFMRQRAIEK